MWTCFDAACKRQMPKEEFSMAQQRYTASQLTQPKYHVCNTCLALRDVEKAKMAADNLKHITKHRKTQ